MSNISLINNSGVKRIRVHWKILIGVLLFEGLFNFLNPVAINFVSVNLIAVEHVRILSLGAS